MGNRIVVSIELDKHYQQFLRHHFKCTGEIFEFPQRHVFNSMLEHFVLPVPEGYVAPDLAGNCFRIMLPVLEYVDKADKRERYMSEIRQQIFRGKIRSYHEWIITDRLSKMMNPKGIKDVPALKLNRDECTLMLIDEYGFNNGDSDAFDRLYRLVSRYYERERMRGIRQVGEQGKKGRDCAVSVVMDYEVGHVE